MSRSDRNWEAFATGVEREPPAPPKFRREVGERRASSPLVNVTKCVFPSWFRSLCFLTNKQLRRTSRHHTHLTHTNTTHARLYVHCHIDIDIGFHY